MEKLVKRDTLMCAEHDRPLERDHDGHFGYCPECEFHPDMQSTYILKAGFSYAADPVENA